MKEEFNRYEPITFGSMSLFVVGGELVLHRCIYRQGRILRGSSVEKIADYYLNYEENELERFRTLADAQVRHFENFCKRKGVLKDISDEKRAEIVDREARNFAARHADNYDDDHDLSPEFCDSAKKIGEALIKFHKAGFETITIHDSPKSLDVVMQSHNRPKVA